MRFLNKIKKDVVAFKTLSATISTKSKKLRIFISVMLRNLASFCEILIVVLFSFLLTGEVPKETFLENLDLNPLSKLIPLFVLMRVGLNYLDHINQEYLIINTSSSLKNRAAEYLFKKENLSFSYINYKVFAETDSITSIYKLFITILGTLFQLLTFSFTLFYLNFSVGLSILIISFVLFIPIKKVIFLFKKNTELNTLNTIETHNNLDRILSNYYLIKLLKKEQSELERFNQTINTSIDLSFKNSKLLFVNHNLLSVTVTLLVSVGVIQTLYDLSLTLETIFLLIRGAQFISQLTSMYSDYLSKRHFIENYLNDLNPELYEKLGTFSTDLKTNTTSVISFNDVSFKYDGSQEFIFENLDLEIEEKTHNIFTGANGSGKSTLIGIIANIYKPNNGQILLKSDSFGYVGPTPLIFKDTLLNNLTYGIEFKVPEELVISSILEMNIFSDFKKEMLEDEITSKSLSSGQMQKVSLIRALLGNPEILFLDEATSNLDKDSVNLINLKLAKFKGTIINVTHKPDQFTGVDNFFEIQSNKIIKKV
jgi:ABC-type bacteriocin/lantibiotic exporter with double-glycine peptidase domain